MALKGSLIAACKRIYHYSVIRMNHYLSEPNPGPCASQVTALTTWPFLFGQLFYSRVSMFYLLYLSAINPAYRLRTSLQVCKFLWNPVKENPSSSFSCCCSCTFLRTLNIFRLLRYFHLIKYFSLIQEYTKTNIVRAVMQESPSRQPTDFLRLCFASDLVR